MADSRRSVGLYFHRHKREVESTLAVIIPCHGRAIVSLNVSGGEHEKTGFE